MIFIIIIAIQIIIMTNLVMVSLYCRITTHICRVPLSRPEALALLQTRALPLQRATLSLLYAQYIHKP